jgi:hypothetical protein
MFSRKTRVLCSPGFFDPNQKRPTMKDFYYNLQKMREISDSILELTILLQNSTIDAKAHFRPELTEITLCMYKLRKKYMDAHEITMMQCREEDATIGLTWDEIAQS